MAVTLSHYFRGIGTYYGTGFSRDIIVFCKIVYTVYVFVLFTQKSSIGLHIPSHSHTLCLATYVATNRNNHFPIAIDRSRGGRTNLYWGGGGGV